jgi:hypothetical protein
MTQLQLHLLNHTGQACNAQWTWPAQSSKLALDQILREISNTESHARGHATSADNLPNHNAGNDSDHDQDNGLDDDPSAWYNQAREIVLVRKSQGQEHLWTLHQNSSKLMCTHNHMHLRQGMYVHLASGDTLELGLARLQIQYIASPEQTEKTEQQEQPEQAEHAGPTNAPATASGPTPAQPPAQATNAASAAPANFELTDLAQLYERPTKYNAHQQLSQADAITDLLQDTASGAPNAPPTPPTGQTLNAVSPQGSAATPPTSTAMGTTTGTAANAAANTPAYTPAYTPLDTPLAQQDDAALQATREELHFDELHTLYLKKVANPHAHIQFSTWENLIFHEEGNVQDAFQELIDLAAGAPPTETLLRENTHIDEVMVRLDQLSDNDLLELPPYDNVLHLFAPEGLQPTQAPQIPSLTQREHHGTSIDSVLFTNFVQPAPLPPSTPSTPNKTTTAKPGDLISDLISDRSPPEST